MNIHRRGTNNDYKRLQTLLVGSDQVLLPSQVLAVMRNRKRISLLGWELGIRGCGLSLHPRVFAEQTMVRVSVG